MTTVTCKLPDTLAAELDALAREQRLSRSSFVREALHQRLKRERKRPVTAYDLVKPLCGSLHGGPSDLALNPEYLNGFGK